ncbi:MAG: LamG domain-containing protein, partial [Rhodospirillales bacterium]
NDKAEISSGWTNYGTDPFTIEAWYRNHGSPDFATIIGTQAGGAGNWQMDFIADKIRFQADSNVFKTSSADTAVLNNWVQAVMVREGTGTDQFKIYFNGVLDSTHTLSTNFNTSSQLRIAANRGNSIFYDGDISIIRIYKNKALTATEVFNNYYYDVYRYVS